MPKRAKKAKRLLSHGKRQREFVARQRRRMAEKARQVAEKLNLNNVEVLESTEGLTGKKATSKGWFDPRTGKITVVVPNHGSMGDIVETVLHEAVAHYGLRKLFGKNFKNFLDNVYRNVTPEIRAEITEQQFLIPFYSSFYSLIKMF